MIVYGPVPSRRLGNSLGINTIPHKVCSYSCRYCQVGKSKKMQITRQPYFQPDEIVRQVDAILCRITDTTQYPDYLSIVPDGEPTLDSNLGYLIDKLKVFKIPIAVISNASIIDRFDVQTDLLKADFVSLKIDAANYDTWRKINIPHKELKLNNVIDGIAEFASAYTGIFVTETMLLKGINDSLHDIESTASAIGAFAPGVAYISIPTRPTAFKTIVPADEEKLFEAYHIFHQHISNVELLNAYEGNQFAASGNSEADLLSITAVHPMREDAVYELIRKNNDSEIILHQLIAKQELKKIEYQGHIFYMRIFNTRLD